MKKIAPQKALNPAYIKHSPSKQELEVFKEKLGKCISAVKLSDEISESEEHTKSHFKDFFSSTFYNKNYINTKGKIDLAIYLDETVNSDVGVLIEAKRPSNKFEFLTENNLNKKALHELLLYYFRERIDLKNNNIKHLIATNGYEWFLFKAEDFYNLFYKNKALVKEYKSFRDGLKDSGKNELFYDEIAQKYIAEVHSELPFVHLDFTNINLNDLDDKDTSIYFKIFSNFHLLGHSFGNDSNKLNRNFYNELLHIIGLEEVTEGAKKVIKRKDVVNRDYGSLLENTIFTLEDRDYLRKVKSVEDTEMKSFNIGLELCLTWINRVLFLKLLESQLVSYHKNVSGYRFLNSEFIDGFDELNNLFFSALAKNTHERHPKYAEKFKLIPYLNSSLFERNDLEAETFEISALNDDQMFVYASSILKDTNDKRLQGKLPTLEYLFKFLDAYDFSTDASDINDNLPERKTLINASVLGLIFEKINGYKDGSFYTPAYITMYMCKETIRRAVVHKFRENENSEIENFDDLKAYCARFFKVEDSKRFNVLVNSVRICDPAVGSGHFLVSALNEIIVIKHELGILVDELGMSLRVDIQIENDDLYISDAHGNLFEYSPNDTESTRIQKTLFEEKKNIIESCLFGVDINPNSVKICRLRLWIELLKNAYYKRTVTSEGTEVIALQTLPNIDINIKCGNSLISRFKVTDDLKGAFRDKDVKYKFSDYKKAVSDYKRSNTKDEKYRVLEIINEVKSNFKSTLDNSILDKVSKAVGSYNNEKQRLENLEQFGEKTKKSEKDGLKLLKIKADKSQALKESIINNAIFNNAFEWRFEFPEILDDYGTYVGFDAIIGNPPYGVSIIGKERDHLNRNIGKVPDYEVYYWFIDRAYQTLKPSGNLSYIIPNSILFNVFAQDYRKNLFEKWSLNEILDCTDINVFDEATVRTIIFQFEKHGVHDKLYYRRTDNIKSFQDLISREVEHIDIDTTIANNQNWSLIFKLDKSVLKLISKIKNNSTALDSLFPEISQGLIAYDKYRGQSKEVISNRSFHTNIKTKETHKSWLNGADVRRYSVEWNGKDYIEYDKGIANPRDPKYFKGKRILIREITNPRIFASLTTLELYNDPSILIIKENEEAFELEILLAILNSKLATFYHFNSSPKATKGAFPKILVYDIKNFPIPKFVNENLLSVKVNKILEVKSINPDADTADLDKQIDDIIYQMYGLSEEEIAIVENA